MNDTRQSHDAKTQSHDVVTNVRTGATKAIDATTTTASDLAERAAAGIEANPLAVLAGGIALGALAGALVPRTTQEAKLLAPVGLRLAETTRGAIDAAKGTVKSEFDGLGFTRDAAKDQIGKMLGDLLKALATAGTAGLSAAKAPVSAASPTAPSAAPQRADVEPVPVAGE